MEVREYKKKDGTSGFAVSLQPTKMSIEDSFEGTFIMDAVRVQHKDSGISKAGKAYDAFDAYDVFLTVDGYENGVGVSIPKGTGMKLQEEGSLRGKTVKFTKGEVKYTDKDGKDSFNMVLAYELDAELSNDVLPDVVKIKALELLNSGKKSPNDTFPFQGKTYKYSDLQK